MCELYILYQQHVHNFYLKWPKIMCANFSCAYINFPNGSNIMFLPFHGNVKMSVFVLYGAGGMGEWMFIWSWLYVRMWSSYTEALVFSCVSMWYHLPSKEYNRINSGVRVLSSPEVKCLCRYVCTESVLYTVCKGCRSWRNGSHPSTPHRTFSLC